MGVALWDKSTRSAVPYPCLPAMPKHFPISHFSESVQFNPTGISTTSQSSPPYRSRTAIEPPIPIWHISQLSLAYTAPPDLYHFSPSQTKSSEHRHKSTFHRPRLRLHHRLFFTAAWPLEQVSPWSGGSLAPHARGCRDATTTTT